MNRDQNDEDAPNELRSGAGNAVKSSRYEDCRRPVLACFRSREEASVTTVLVIKRERGKK